MKVFLGADHRGFKLKEYIKKRLKVDGYGVEDVGAIAYDSEDDYVDYAKAVSKKIGKKDKGVLFCGSGHGMDIVANKHKGIRSILGFNLDVVVQGRKDEDANVLSLPADWLVEEEVYAMVEVFLMTDFSEEDRHKRRIRKIEEIE